MSLFDLFQLRLFAEADIHFLPALPPFYGKSHPIYHFQAYITGAITWKKDLSGQRSCLKRLKK
jgi:hypothetical protein